MHKTHGMEYKKRIADELLHDKLEAMGAVLIEGPKACGKTTTAEQHAKSVIYMDDSTKQHQYRKEMVIDTVRIVGKQFLQPHAQRLDFITICLWTVHVNYGHLLEIVAERAAVMPSPIKFPLVNHVLCDSHEAQCFVIIKPPFF